MTSRVVLTLAAVVLLLGACSDDDGTEATHPLLDDETPATDEPTPEAGDAEPTPVPTERQFPVECSDVISAVRVAEIVATVPTSGHERTYIEYEDSPRLERLECSYGINAGNDDDEDDDAPDVDGAVVEIFVSSYVDADAAAAQVGLNIDNARIAGRQIDELEIAGREVHSLASDERISYLVADGDWTYVVTLARGVLEEAAEQVVLLELMQELLGAS